ncbi:hypothetical protein RclHR1_05700009 [Rhizophagus clarus]|uniref:F-box domain-containing protein n=1 Tax=Rhizophagus clarus TaxID=94130 RepID=A0A2Z6RPM8_9GLOM|nr:hypothetical protein RclHR1_05700009 [Rhizophagus clarus]GES78798.1 hypothetical protein GLOIN_2v1669673 [Rhizophagus clarus]
MNSYEEGKPIAPPLPSESMIEILKHLENDKKSLHSCVLINRHWCRQSISHLWVEPFTSKLSDKSTLSLLRTYFGCLKNEDKILFTLEVGEFLPRYSTTSPFFNYASFLKKLNTRLLGHSVSLWVNLEENLFSSNKSKSEITNLMLKALYKLFIKSGAKLNSLTLDVSAGSMDIAAEISLFRTNLNFISNIRKLNCIFSNPSSEIFYNMSDLWDELPKICTGIRVLDVDANDMHWSSGQTLANLIKSQTELSNVKFRSFGSRVTSAVAMLAKKSDTLTSLEFEYIDFRKVSLDGLENCAKLEEIRFIGGNDCNINTFRPLINAKCKIKTLELNEIYDSESLIALLENVGWSLEHLIIHPIINTLMEVLPTHCPNITYLNILVTSPFIPQLFSLVSGCQLLEYLVIRTNSITDSEIIVNEMGRVVPSSLHYLEFIMPLTSNQLNTFLMDCQAPLKTLIIDSYHIFLTDSHIKAIRNFTIRKGTLKYVNIGVGGLNMDYDRLYIEEISRYLNFLPSDKIKVRY